MLVIKDGRKVESIVGKIDGKSDRIVVGINEGDTEIGKKVGVWLGKVKGALVGIVEGSVEGV